MESIDVAEIEICVERSIRLLQRTYQPHESGGGWYHELDAGPAGPSATAVGLLAMQVIARSPEHAIEALAFLRARQVRSPDRLTDGGWPVNTSNGVPVTACTALVLLSLARCETRFAVAPDLRRAVQWLERNQNTDGGWGSFRDRPSRTWLTALSVRALATTQTSRPAVDRGVQWLRDHGDPAGGWAELPGAPPTVTHTAFVLTALHSAGTAAHDAILRRGYAWLIDHVNPRSLHDDEARHESYNVSRTAADGTVSTWVSAVWHPGLPYAVAALARCEDEAAAPLLFVAVDTLLRRQRDDGRWPGADGAARLSMWDVFPYLDALHDLRTIRLARPGDTIVLLRPGAALIQRPSARSIAPGRLLDETRRVRWRPLLRRHWAAGILALSVALRDRGDLDEVHGPGEVDARLRMSQSHDRHRRSVTSP